MNPSFVVPSIRTGYNTVKETMMEPDINALLDKAKRPVEEAPGLHKKYRGKVEVLPRCRIKDMSDFNIWYTPGVAAPCRLIQDDPELAYEYTCKWNTVAVVSDGTRVLGLGDIGPVAALPVMEGKALIFKYLGGVDAFPICLDTKDPGRFIETVKILQPSFGGINLEDIAQPKCFEILDRLRKECEIPVWHDDQQGTAAVTLAGLINALKVVSKRMEEVRIVFLGAGAANIRIADVVFKAGADPKKCLMVDSRGILHEGREDIQGDPAKKEKWLICRTTNSEHARGDAPRALEGADVLIALSKPGPGTVKPEWIRRMAVKPVVFACANPIPEIWPWEAKKAGAAVVATGRGDFPNQVNNSLGFPGIFRGTLDVRATTITDEMCIEAAKEIAKTAEDRGLSEDYIVPTMDEWEVFPREAAAVGSKAVAQGIARKNMSKEELFRHSENIIREAREKSKLLIERLSG
jgi:malate dehydrogenase (oxaloacetate-decarboxylating)